MLCNDFIHPIKLDDHQLTDEDGNDNEEVSTTNSPTHLDSMFVIGDEDDDDDGGVSKEINHVEEVKKNINDKGNNTDSYLGQSICCEGRFNFYLPRNTSIEDYHNHEEFKCNNDDRADETNLIHNLAASKTCDDNVNTNTTTNDNDSVKNENDCINNNNETSKNNNINNLTSRTVNQSKLSDVRKVKSKQQKKTNRRTKVEHNDYTNEKDERLPLYNFFSWIFIDFLLLIF